MTTSSEVFISCLLFGEVRAILGDKDTLPIRVLVPSDAAGGSISTEELWRCIGNTLKEFATTNLQLDARGCALLAETLSVSMLAIDDEFVEVSAAVPVAMHVSKPPSVAVIPPVSGG